MKTNYTLRAFWLLALALSVKIGVAQENNFDVQRINPENGHLSYITAKKTTSLPLLENGIPTINQALGLEDEYSWKLLSVEEDKFGYRHYRLRQTFASYSVEGTMYIVHTKNGLIQSANGEYASSISQISPPSITEKQALTNAINNVGASVYKWQLPGANEHIKIELNDPNATYFPKGELVIAKNADNDQYVLCFRFDIYAHQPISREYIFIDAQTGELVDRKSRIAHSDVPASGQTRYSGIVDFICDSTPTHYRLREVARGNGIETYNMQNGTDYTTAVDFTHPDPTWDTLPNGDTLAIDAHFGAEATYDYMKNIQNRKQH